MRIKAPIFELTVEIKLVDHEISNPMVRILIAIKASPFIAMFSLGDAFFIGISQPSVRSFDDPIHVKYIMRLTYNLLRSVVCARMGDLIFALNRPCVPAGYGFGHKGEIDLSFLFFLGKLTKQQDDQSFCGC